MINIETLKKWKREDTNNEKLYSLFIGFDNLKRDKYFTQGYFDIENIIPDKELSAKKLSEIIENKIGKEFVARLENQQFPWNPHSLSSPVDLCEVEEFLSKCSNLQVKNTEYYGEIKIDCIYYFLKIFLDYPQKLNYQDIEIFSSTSNFVLNISNHGTFWLVGMDKDIVNKIELLLQKQEFIVLKGNE